MRRFLKNTKGAVTVIVTLLLIPAMLVSGTAVDLARIHTARSIVQDANQLAANSVLTQYDAMLQDIYGLYGVMESDPILGDMLNEYIRVTIFGEGRQDKQLGTFQLFYGAGLQPTTVSLVDDQNLRNPAVLRRQIEEYAKFRAPVIVVNEIWDRLAKLEKVKADSDVIEQKLEIDEKFDDIDHLYKEIYNLINEINSYPSSEKSAFESINKILTDINAEMKELKKTRDDWTDAFDASDINLMRDLRLKYDEIKENIRSLVDGGDVGNGWISGYYNVIEWVDGRWSSTRRSNGLNDVIDVFDTYIEKINLLVQKCEEADNRKAELARRIDNLERKLNSGECSDDMVNGMTKPITIKDQDGNVVGTRPSMIEEYRSLLKHSLKPMAEAVKNKNEPYINRVIGIVNDVGYGYVVNNELKSPSLSKDQLIRLSDQVFDIDLIVQKRSAPPDTKPSYDTEWLNQLAALTNYKYAVPSSSGFVPFQASEFNSTHNKEFYDRLHEMYGNPANESYRDQQKSKANQLMKDKQDEYKGLSLKINGAEYYKDLGGKSGAYGSDGDWGKDGEARKQTKTSLNTNITSQDGDFSTGATNFLLLLIYDTEMFSNFTTVENTKTMSGVPMNTDVNYFFQSEVEYLFTGNKGSATNNVATVSGLILLLRFVSNYVATFVISEIGYELLMLSAPAGPFALIVQEVLRFAYAVGESFYDMSQLLQRPSRPVALIKTKITDWTVCIRCLAHATGDRPEPTLGTYYIDYLRIFLLLVKEKDLAERTGDLISWNLTNVKENIGADAERMSKTPLYDVSKYHTDFEITTSVDMRMLFLSMPFAQKGVNGVIPPKTRPVTVTDYRGY